jgi:large subunit ribosomal protein L14
MIQNRTVLNVLDNSGVQKIRVIQVKGQKSSGNIGDLFVGSAIKVRPNSKFKKGDLVRGLLIQSRKKTTFLRGKSIQFTQNACIVLSNKGDPVGTRINCAVPTEIRSFGYARALILTRKRV